MTVSPPLPTETALDADADAVLARIAAELPELSPKLARAAACLVERPDEIAFTSMRRMASLAGVQPAIMVRLAQRLGFDGYAALRAPFRLALEQRPEDPGQRARALQARVRHHGGGKPLNRLAGELFALDRESLAATAETCRFDRLAEAAQLLADAPNIFVAGQHGALAAIHHFRDTVSLFRDGVVLLDAPGDHWADAMRGIESPDVLLITSVDAFSPQLSGMAEFALGREAQVVAIVDHTVAPGVDPATLVLPFVARGSGVMPTFVPALALIQILAAQMLALGGQAALDTIAISEEQRSALTVA